MRAGRSSEHSSGDRPRDEGFAFDARAGAQAHINTILDSLTQTFQTFQDDGDSPDQFTDFLDAGMQDLYAVRAAGAIVPIYSYAELLAQTSLLSDQLAGTKSNCHSGSLYGDRTCDVYSKMYEDLEMAENLLGVCDDFDMVTLPSFTAFCSTPANNGNDLLPNYMLDAVSDPTRYITFGAGARVEMEYSFTQTSTMEQVIGYSAAAEFESSLQSTTDMDIVGVAIGFEEAYHLKGELEIELGRSAEKSQERAHTVTITLGDDEPGDVFAVKVQTDTVYGTPIFTTIGGESTCPGETATTRRAEFVTIYDIIPHCKYGFEVQEGADSCSGVTPGDAIYFGVILQNTMDTERETTADWEMGFSLQVAQVYESWDAGKDYYDADQGGCGADGSHLGLSISVLDKSVADVSDIANFGNGIAFGQWEYLLKIEHGPDTACDSYKGIELGLYPTCTGDDWTYQYQEQLNADGSITVVHPFWRNLTYCAGQGDDCEPNSFDPSTEANGYWTSSFTIPDFSWDRCSSDLDLTDSATWETADGDGCPEVGQNPASNCAWQAEDLTYAYDYCLAQCCDYVPDLGTTTRRKRRRSLADVADDAKLRKVLKHHGRANAAVAPKAPHHPSPTTIIHEGRRFDHVLATVAAAVVFLLSLAYVHLSQRAQTAKLERLEAQLAKVLELQAHGLAPPRA